MKGLFKDAHDWVRVQFGDGREIDMPKERYVALKRDPPFEELPLSDDFGYPRNHPAT
jgi:hypothetical protein